MKLKIRHIALDIDVTLSNRSDISVLKQKYLETRKLDIEPEKLRLIFKGKELQNDFFVYSYDLVDGSVVVAMGIPKQENQ